MNVTSECSNSALTAYAAVYQMVSLYYATDGMHAGPIGSNVL